MNTSRVEIQVFIADSCPAFLRGVESTIQQEADLLLLGKAEDGGQTIREIRRYRPHVCLIELEMPEINGLNIIASIIREGISTRIIILTDSVEGSVVQSAMASGAVGFLSKREPLEEICEAIRSAYNGFQVLSESAQAELQKHQLQQAKNSVVTYTPALPNFLTGRELQILRCIAQGISIAETARELHISSTTVKHHRQVIFAKLGVANAPAAVYTAVRENLIT